MKYFKILLALISTLVLFAEDDPMKNMTIEYGGHDILKLGDAYKQQEYVNPDYYENVIEHVQGGNQLAKRGDFQAAIMRFQIALDNDSTYVFAHNGIANAYLALNNIDMAESHFKKAIQYGPTYAFSYNNLANVYLLKGDEDIALSNLQTAHKYEPNSAYINYNIGNIYLNQGLTSLAQYYYNKALALDEDFCNARYNLAITYKRLKNDARSIKEYEILVNKCPGHKKGVLNLAAHYINSNEVEKALILYKQAVLLNPDPELYLALGHAYHNEGYSQQEINAYRSAVESDSTNMNALFYLATSYYEQDMPISAVDVCNKALKIDPNNKKIQNILDLIVNDERNK
jgi:tetratricopeptide (TPR) repeat protein